jgi:hypothetical protein
MIITGIFSRSVLDGHLLEIIGKIMQLLLHQFLRFGFCFNHERFPIFANISLLLFLRTDGIFIIKPRVRLD